MSHIDLAILALFAPTALFIYTHAAFGVAYLIGHSKASEPIRDFIMGNAEVATASAWRVTRRTFVMLIECPVCISTWIGGFAGIVLGRALGGHHAALAVLFACYTAGASFLLGKLTHLID